MELTKFVPLDKIKKPRVAYMVSNRDPSLITMSNEDVLAHTEAAKFTAINQRPKESDFIYFKMMPKTLLGPAIQKDPPDQKRREELFQYIIQYCKQSSWKEERPCPQSYIY